MKEIKQLEKEIRECEFPKERENVLINLLGSIYAGICDLKNKVESQEGHIKRLERDKSEIERVKERYKRVIKVALDIEDDDY